MIDGVGKPDGGKEALPEAIPCAKADVVTIEGILGALIIGLVIGALGRLILPGKQDIPIWLTIVVGIVAALIGSALVGSLRDTNGIDWVELLVQLVLAVIGVALVTRMRGGGQRTHG
jgi:uncharacterized membrane protein YeaQ/YmgE (transglycosylase-associated protein family)